MFQYVVDVAIFLFSLLALGYIYALAWRFWIMAIQTESQAKLSWIMLEVRLPRVIDKSPKAFEIALAAFLQTGGIGNRFNIYWKGNMPAYHTLEIVSFEGEIHFYIRILSKYKNIVMNNIYSQYPTVEVVEVNDYMDMFKMTHHTSKDKFGIFGINYNVNKKITLGKKKKDKIKDGIGIIWKAISYIFYGVFVDIYDGISKMFSDGHHDDHSAKNEDNGMEDGEIKSHHLMLNTYIDYGMDKDPKEIFKHDPLTTILEWLGNMKNNQFGVYQISICDEGNFKSSTHSPGGPKGGDKWPKFYEIYDDNGNTKLVNSAELAKARLDQIRYSKKEVKHMKGDPVYDNYGNPVMKRVDSGQKDAEGKPIMKEVPVTYGADQKVGGERIKENEFTAEEKLEIEIINRKLSKPTFLTTIRAAYITLNGANEDNGQHINSMLGLFRAYRRGEFDYGLGGGPATGDTYDYSWEDTFKKKKPWRDEEFFEALVERECFFAHVNFDAKSDTQWDLLFWNKTLGQKKLWRMIYDSVLHPFTHVHAENVMVLNTEELATLYHFPGEVAATPGLKRIDSIKGEAPGNLPI